MTSNSAHTSNSTHSQLILRHLQLYFDNSGNLGQIRKIEISKESGGHASHDYDICACACKHACMQSIFWCLCLYLSQIGLDQRACGIYGIRRTCWTFLSTYFNLCMQASVQARFGLVCTGPYFSQIRSN